MSSVPALVSPSTLGKQIVILTTLKIYFFTPQEVPMKIIATIQDFELKRKININAYQKAEL